MKKLFVLLFVVLLFSCEEPNCPLFEKTGQIAMFGNEPFAKIGIYNDTEVFLLVCDNATETQLKKKQGCLITVKYSECFEDWEGTKLVIKQIIYK